MPRVVIAGHGPLARQLRKQLSGAHEVRLTEGFDLTARHEAEVALAGAQVVVMLASARGIQTPLKTARKAHLDALLADSVARASKLVGASRLVHFECGEADVRTGIFEKSGVPLVTLRGGGPDPVAALAALVEGGDAPPASAWSGTPGGRDTPRWPTASVQKVQPPTGWDALKLAREHFAWLPSAAPMTRVQRLNDTYSIYAGGVRALVLRYVPGRSDESCAWFEVADGSLAERGHGRFEFRLTLDGGAYTALIGYRPTLPFALYRVSQALVHERAMKRFISWLAAQS